MGQPINPRKIIRRLKASVATYNDLPITGNNPNDARFVRDTDILYVWSVDTPDGILANWKTIGGGRELELFHTQSEEESNTIETTFQTKTSLVLPAGKYLYWINATHYHTGSQGKGSQIVFFQGTKIIGASVTIVPNAQLTPSICKVMVLTEETTLYIKHRAFNGQISYIGNARIIAIHLK